MASPARANISQAKVLHTSAYEVEVRGCDAVLAAGEALTYHADPVDADHLVNSLFQRVAQLLPTGGMLIFDLIGLGEPLTGGSWRPGDDWAVLVETVEDQTERKLIRNIDTFCQLNGSYRRGHEVHSVRPLDVSQLRGQLAGWGVVTERAQS